MLIQRRKMFLEFFSNDNEIRNKNLTFDTFFAMTKILVKLIFKFKCLFATTTNMRNAIEIDIEK